MMSDSNQPAPDPGRPEIARNDARQQRQLRNGAIAVLIVVLCIGLLFRYWQAHANAYDLLHRMYSLSYLTGICLLAIAWYAWRYAGRIFAASQYPPPGGWVLSPTRVLRDDDARMRGRQVIACAIVLALLGLYALYLPHSITAAFGHPKPIQITTPLPSEATGSSAATQQASGKAPTASRSGKAEPRH